MKTCSLPFILAAIIPWQLDAADQKPSAKPDSLPEITEYKAQDARVKKLRAELDAELKKLNEMKATFVDCANGNLPDKSAGSPPVISGNHAEFTSRYEALQLYEAEKAKAKKEALIAEKKYYPFKIRKTVVGQKESLDPATISYLKNNNGHDSYAVDAGILWDPLAFELKTFKALDWGPLDKIQIAPFTEYHRNTAASALNDTLIFGANARLTLDKGDAAADFFQYIDFSGGWKNQALKEGRSFFAQLQYAPLMRCYGIGLFGNGRLLDEDPDEPNRYSLNTSEWDQVRIVPTVALAYQHVYDGVLPAYEGDNLVLKASADIEYFPKAWFPGLLQDKLVLRAGYTFWSYLSHTQAVSVPDRNMSFFRAAADYYIDGKRPGPSDPSTGHDGHYAIGLEYTRGDNPDTGAFDVDQWLLSLRVFF